MDGGEPPYDPAAESHRALRAIRRELERHPAVERVRGFPPESHAQVEATLDPIRLGAEAADATLTARWFAGETADDPPQFSFHYSDETGLDFGWHHELNPHVDGRGHFQERPDSTSSYAYEPYAFSTHVPSRVVWEVLSLLPETLAGGEGE